jgi:hypothetical protein
VPSLRKTLNDISLEKDAAVVAKVLSTFFVTAFVLPCTPIMHAEFSFCLWPGILSRRML